MIPRGLALFGEHSRTRHWRLSCVIDLFIACMHIGSALAFIGMGFGSCLVAWSLLLLLAGWSTFSGFHDASTVRKRAEPCWIPMILPLFVFFGRRLAAGPVQLVQPPWAVRRSFAWFAVGPVRRSLDGIPQRKYLRRMHNASCLRPTEILGANLETTVLYKKEHAALRVPRASLATHFAKM